MVETFRIFIFKGRVHIFCIFFFYFPHLVDFRGPRRDLWLLEFQLSQSKNVAHYIWMAMGDILDLDGRSPKHQSSCQGSQNS